MASKKQIAANRRNARKSTGPSTAEGKARSARNAVTHGLTSRAPVLPDEDAQEYAVFAAGVRADIAPEGVLEEALAVRVAEGMWRLLRVSRIEAACFAHELAQASDRAARLRDIPGLPPRAADSEEHALGATFLKLDADGLPNSLARYEAAIQRGVERSLKLLQETRKLRAAAENAALRNEPDCPAASAGQSSPAEERVMSPGAGQAPGQSSILTESSRDHGSSSVLLDSAESEPAPAVQPTGSGWPDELPNVMGCGYEPARPGERIEHRRHGNTRYIVRVPIEDETARL